MFESEDDPVDDLKDFIFDVLDELCLAAQSSECSFDPTSPHGAILRFVDGVVSEPFGRIFFAVSMFKRVCAEAFPEMTSPSGGLSEAWTRTIQNLLARHPRFNSESSFMILCAMKDDQKWPELDGLGAARRARFEARALDSEASCGSSPKRSRI